MELERDIRVLVVEDDPGTCDLLCSFLDRSAGLSTCGTAHNGWDALEMLHALKPDLMLLDLIMPGMDGLKLLRSLDRETMLKTIVLSGVGSDAYVQATIRLGASYYMVKPVDLTELARQIHVLFPQERPDPALGAAAWTLLRLGADRDSAGFRFAVFALEVLRTEGRDIQMKRVYLETAEVFGTNYACVEKNLRTLIRNIHRGGQSYYSRALGLGGGEKPPGNGEFLRRLSELLDRNIP